jgi:hypothetical protein
LPAEMDALVTAFVSRAGATSDYPPTPSHLFSAMPHSALVTAEGIEIELLSRMDTSLRPVPLNDRT